MHRLICPLALLSLCACGPLPLPMFTRLPLEVQVHVNGMWDNMLKPPDRLDRELLLDVILANELHAMGVDRGTFHSEKDLTDGRVMMDIQFDRLKPLEDRFDLTVYDASGKLVRSEHYTSDEINSHWRALGEPTTEPVDTAPVDVNGRPIPEPESEKLQRISQQVRWAQIYAATRPTE